jgi:hypothetical protein
LPALIKSKPSKKYALNIYRKWVPLPTASVNSNPDSLYQAIDGRCWYFPEIKNIWSTYGSTSKIDWYVIDFGTPRTVSSVEISIYADNLIYKMPKEYNIEYWNFEKWLPVNNIVKLPSKPIGNTVNQETFESISTTQIKINFKNESK